MFSGGRFELGLGSQVKGNVVGRFGMPWSAPVARMRDYVGALRAIFECWQRGTELQYESESYTLTRLQPFFRPEPLEAPQPSVRTARIHLEPRSEHGPSAEVYLRAILPEGGEHAVVCDLLVFGDPAALAEHIPVCRGMVAHR